MARGLEFCWYLILWIKKKKFWNQQIPFPNWRGETRLLYISVCPSLSLFNLFLPLSISKSCWFVYLYLLKHLILPRCCFVLAVLHTTPIILLAVVHDLIHVVSLTEVSSAVSCLKRGFHLSWLSMDALTFGVLFSVLKHWICEHLFTAFNSTDGTLHSLQISNLIVYSNCNRRRAEDNNSFLTFDLTLSYPCLKRFLNAVLHFKYWILRD